jgi:hypothetical protein
LGTTPPTDLLHRALLINTALLIPIYNHIFMALSVHQETMKKLHQEVLDFLWNRQEEGEKSKKEGSWPKTEFLPASTEGGCKSHIQPTLPKVFTSTYSRRSKTEYDCLRDSHSLISLQY